MVRWYTPTLLQLQHIVAACLLCLGMPLVAVSLGLVDVTLSYLLAITVYTTGPVVMIIIFAKSGSLGRFFIMLLVSFGMVVVLGFALGIGQLL